MQRRWKFVLGALALPVLLAGGVVLALANATLPIKSVAEILPDDVVAFARVDDLAGLYDAMKETEAFKDLERSRLLRTAIAAGAFDEFEELLARRAKRLGLEPTLETYKMFIGREVGVGVRIDRESGRPSYIMTYRVDTPALMKRLAVENPSALAKLLTERYFPDAKPNATHYGGFDIFALGEQAHYALIRDVFVASDSRETIERTIDLALAGGAGSLGRSERYGAELARLPEDTVLSVYFDAGRLRDKALIKRLSGGEFKGVFFDELDRRIRPFPALALGVSVPGADLYRIEVGASRSADELLIDNDPVPPSALVPEDGAFYAETIDARELIARFERSALHDRLVSSAAFKKLLGYLDQPERLEEDFGIDLDLPPVPPDVACSTRFERTVLWRALTGALARIWPGALALQIDRAPETASTPAWVQETAKANGLDLKAAANLPVRFTFAVELPPLLRVAESVLTAFAAEMAAQDGARADVLVRSTDAASAVIGGATDYDWDPQSQELVATRYPFFGYVRLGRALVVSDDFEHLGALLETPRETLKAPKPRAEGLPKGHYALSVMDMERYYDMFAANSSDPELAMYRSLFVGSGKAATGYYVSDDFLTWTQEGVAKSGLLREIYLEQAHGPFAAWKLLPQDVVVHAALRYEPKRFATMIRDVLERNPAALADYETWLGQFDELTGVDFEGEFLEALGSELTFSLSPQSLPESAPKGALALPALSLTWKLDQPDKVMQVLERVRAEMITPKLPPDADEQTRAQVPSHRTLEVAGTTLHVIDLPPASGMSEQTGGTVSPGYALIGDTLVISSSESALSFAAERAKSAGPSYADAPARLRAAKAVGGDDTLVLFAHFDCAGFARLLEGYAPQLAQLVPPREPAGLERPEWPGPEGDMEAFEREYAAYQRAMQEAQAKQAQEVESALRKMSGALAKWFDFTAYGVRTEEGKVRATSVFKMR